MLNNVKLQAAFLAKTLDFLQQNAIYNYILSVTHTTDRLGIDNQDVLYQCFYFSADQMFIKHNSKPLYDSSNTSIALNVQNMKPEHNRVCFHSLYILRGCTHL